jgi:hypothetical protein
MNDRPPRHDRPPPLDDLLAAIPRNVEPPARLWREIVFGIARRQRQTRYLALAASMACAVLAAAVIWAVLRAAPESRARLPLVATRTAPLATAPSFAEPGDAKYLATRASLQATFRERLALLDPTTRAQIEASLAVIQRAHEDIRRALAAAPADPLLQQLFESTWHEEFDLYVHVVHATQPTAAKT